MNPPAYAPAATRGCASWASCSVIIDTSVERTILRGAGRVEGRAAGATRKLLLHLLGVTLRVAARSHRGLTGQPPVTEVGGRLQQLAQVVDRRMSELQVSAF
ncbi:hypothetical protein [Paraburkholderia sp. MM6662-R1]|uniref:hypothetical protein n=1 Tax=Paraburkholderia sp. MM6662-R1 TaxID=2991066 RepID=UPI003D2371F8